MESEHQESFDFLLSGVEIAHFPCFETQKVYTFCFLNARKWIEIRENISAESHATVTLTLLHWFKEYPVPLLKR